MQALTRHICQFRKSLESQGRVDEISKNHPCSLCFSAEEQRRRFIKKRLRERRITFDSSDNCLFEISRQCHCAYLFGRLPLASALAAAFLALYST